MRTLTSLSRPATHSAPNASTLAVVLAGGNGTRLGDLTRWECKPALPFGGKFRNIDFSLSNCIHSGIRRIAVLTQYKSQTLIHHLEEAWSFLPRALGEFVEIWPAQQRVQPDWYTGTANAVYQNLDMIRRHAPRLILVLAGDHVYKMDYRRLLAEHVQSNAEVTVGCVPVPAAEAGNFGVLTLGAGARIASFVEKPSPARLGSVGDTVLASMGVYVFNADYLYERLARDMLDKASMHDFGRDLLPTAVAAAEAGAFVFEDPQTRLPGYWRDVGTLDSYWQAHMELLDRTVDFTVFDPAWPILTHPRQLPPAHVLSGTHSGAAASSLADSLVSEGCVIDSAAVNRSVLGPAVKVGAGSSIDQAVILPDAQIGARCRLRRAIVESGCIVPPGSVIGEDPELDAARFAISAGGIVLVTAASLSRAGAPGGAKTPGDAPLTRLADIDAEHEGAFIALINEERSGIHRLDCRAGPGT